MFGFTLDEADVAARLSVVGGWKHEDAQPLKDKIRNYLIGTGDSFCCYCLRDMHKSHRLDIDTEHVLPKRFFPQYTFEPLNLNLSCKRCNMKIKGEDVSFFLGAPNEAEPFVGDLYTIIHPNLDDAGEHLVILKIQFNRNLLIKYYPVKNSSKGQATYDYFKLKDVEKDAFDEAQGKSTVDVSERMPSHFVNIIQELKEQIEK